MTIHIDNSQTIYMDAAGRQATLVVLQREEKGDFEVRIFMGGDLKGSTRSPKGILVRQHKDPQFAYAAWATANDQLEALGFRKESSFEGIRQIILLLLRINGESTASEIKEGLPEAVRKIAGGMFQRRLSELVAAVQIHHRQFNGLSYYKAAAEE